MSHNLSSLKIIPKIQVARPITSCHNASLLKIIIKIQENHLMTHHISLLKNNFKI
jgi:hypothetical protein